VPDDKQVAYFSMEIALEPAMPTYSGGLGVLAGDTIRAAADRGIRMVAVTLLHRKGYFHQELDRQGRQTETPADWPVEQFVKELPPRIHVSIEGRLVSLRAWQYEVEGVAGDRVPVILLDADLPENSDWDRRLTHWLYGGDPWYRLCQEIVLGIGGVRMLRALGHERLARFHMNEGHAGLLGLELLDEHARRAGRGEFNHDDVEAVRQLCVFTTHTPVPAGHDQFPLDLVGRALGRSDFAEHHDVFCSDGVLNMTYLALSLSHYVNGVAKKHAEVSQHLFAQYRIDAITNGVHVPTWAAPSTRALFDKYIPGWREDSFMLRYALSIPPDEVRAAHAEAKRALLERVNRETGAGMDEAVLTLGFARRAATYKRTDLLFRDLDRLRAVVARAGRFQVVFAGKAHPQDQGGKELIQHIFQARDALGTDLRVAYLANYDWELGRLLTAGADVWLNTPQPPMEASGTSGMKAAVNGVPSLSVLDGWWIEGCIEGVTGWALGERCDLMPAGSDQLEQVVLPLYYHHHSRFLDVMRHAMALNGAFFNTQRMVLQYVLKAYYE
jgi:starch phosphorylase